MNFKKQQCLKQEPAGMLRYDAEIERRVLLCKRDVDSWRPLQSLHYGTCEKEKDEKIRCALELWMFRVEFGWTFSVLSCGSCRRHSPFELLCWWRTGAAHCARLRTFAMTQIQTVSCFVFLRDDAACSLFLPHEFLVLLSEPLQKKGRTTKARTVMWKLW